MKALKKLFIVSLAFAVSLTAGSAMAGRHHGGGSKAVGNRGACMNRTMSNIFSGEAAKISGKITEMGTSGQGMIKIDAADAGIITVYGIGPYFYWNQLKVNRPVVGDSIIVDGYNVKDSDGNTRFIAASVTIGDNEVALRDASTGAPLWWNSTNCPRRGMNPNCPYSNGTSVAP